MRIATWNVNSLNVRLQQVLDWLSAASPDVLCLQETKLTDEAFSKDYEKAFASLGYESVHTGEEGKQKGRNGVAVVSKAGLKDVQTGFESASSSEQEQARLIWATCGEVRVASAYIPNGKDLKHADYKYKLDWLSRLADCVRAESMPLAIVGDFNVAPEDIDVWDPRDFKDSTHVSQPERDALADVVEAGLVDVFRQRYGSAPNLFTFWDYQQGRFHANKGLRIDFILASLDLAKKLQWVFTDIDPRKPRKDANPSDHAPVVAQF